MLRLDKTRRANVSYNPSMKTNADDCSRCFSLFALFAFLSAAMLSSLPAQAQSDTDAAAILAQAIQASGGDAWGAVHTLHIRSSTLGGGVTGTQDEWDDARTGRYFVGYKSALSSGADGFDGVSVWHQASGGYSYVLGDEDARQGAINQAYQTCRAFWFPERGNATLALAHPQAEGGKLFDVVAITPQAGRPFTMWIDQATHLIDRFVEQQGEGVQVTEFSDYRTVEGGIKLPFTVKIGDGGSDWDDVATVQSVAVNALPAPNAFAVPKNPAPDFRFQGDKSSTTVPFKLVDDKLLVPVIINGHGPYDAELDTGGNYIVQPALAEKLGLTGQGAFREGGGGEANVSVGRVTVSSIEIGDVRLTNQPYKILRFSSSAPERTIVGLQLLQRFVVSLDFDRGLMTLTRPDRYTYKGTGVSVPFHFQDNQPEVNGAVDGVAGVFTIDTGDDGSLLLIAPFVNRYGLVQRYGAIIPYGGYAVGGATHGLMARAGELALLGADGRPVVTAANPVTELSQQQRGFDADRYVSGNVGIGILKQFNLVFDYSRQQIIFEKNRRYGKKDVYNRTGLQLQRSGASWLVTHIAANSPASDAGVKIGDMVLSVNGRDTSQAGSDDLYYLFRESVGTRILLVVQSGESRRTVELLLRDVL